MRVEDIGDYELRQWATAYVAKRLNDRRDQKQSADDLKAIWKTWSELDWWAFRELPGMRERAKAFWERIPEQFFDEKLDRWFPKQEWDSWYEKVIQDEIESRSKSKPGKYRTPYSFGLEIEALARAAKLDLPKKRKTVQVEDFNP